MKMTIYATLMRLGHGSGCHQMPERSFAYKGNQFPICARCTGVLFGNVIAYGLFLFYALPIQYCVAGCSVMFADWLIQHLRIRSSTNLRRLVTGVVGGYATSTLYCLAIQWIGNRIIGYIC